MTNAEGEFHEFEAKLANFHRSSWTDLPAQCSPLRNPEPVPTPFLHSHLATPEDPCWAWPNYLLWLYAAFGPMFADNFPAAYTRKYWTRQAERATNRINRVRYSHDVHC